MKVGNKVRFTYLKDAKTSIINGILTRITLMRRTIKVRSLRFVPFTNPVSNQTLRYGNIKGDRSENLVTVELKNGDTKAFYDGRMVNLKVRKYA